MLIDRVGDFDQQTSSHRKGVDNLAVLIDVLIGKPAVLSVFKPPLRQSMSPYDESLGPPARLSLNAV